MLQCFQGVAEKLRLKVKAQTRASAIVFYYYLIVVFFKL